jgi:hypothetical protein
VADIKGRSRVVNDTKDATVVYDLRHHTAVSECGIEHEQVQMMGRYSFKLAPCCKFVTSIALKW